MGLASGVVADRGVGTDAVRVNVGYDTDAARRAAVDVAYRVIYEFSFGAVTITTTGRDADRLAARGDVDYVEADPVVGVDPVDVRPVDPATHGGPAGGRGEHYPWGIDRVDADVVQEKATRSGGGVHIAIIDTGIDLTHPALAENVGTGIVLQAGVSTSEVVGPQYGIGQDDNGHGTHVAGITGAVGSSNVTGTHYGRIGIAPDVTLHPVKVLNASGRGLASDVAQGIELADGEDWDLANLSVGGPSNTHENAVGEADMPIVAAAGNNGKQSAEPPANKADWAVSATPIFDEMAAYSSKADSSDDAQPIAAPGDAVPSTHPGGYAVMSGTSMAAPHVAGAATLGGHPETDETVGGIGLLEVAKTVTGSPSGDDLGGIYANFG